MGSVGTDETTAARGKQRDGKLGREREDDGDCQLAMVSDGPRLPSSDLTISVRGVLRHHRVPEPTHCPPGRGRPAAAQLSVVAPCHRPRPGGWCCLPLLNAPGHCESVTASPLSPPSSLPSPLLVLCDSSGLATSGPSIPVVLGTTPRRPQDTEQIIFLGLPDSILRRPRFAGLVRSVR